MADHFDYKGYRFTLAVEPDQDSGPPWEDHDGHGPVSDWTTRDKRPGERVLVEDHGSRRYYDVAGALKLAKQDQWGTKDGQRAGESLKAYRARAVEEDYEYLRAWCADEWRYVGVVVTLGDATEHLWGIEDSETAYLQQVARELADEILSEQPARERAARLMDAAPELKAVLTALLVRLAHDGVEREVWPEVNQATALLARIEG